VAIEYVIKWGDCVWWMRKNDSWLNLMLHWKCLRQPTKHFSCNSSCVNLESHWLLPRYKTDTLQLVTLNMTSILVIVHQLRFIQTWYFIKYDWTYVIAFQNEEEFLLCVTREKALGTWRSVRWWRVAMFRNWEFSFDGRVH
jgi:hypothetical protein